MDSFNWLGHQSSFDNPPALVARYSLAGLLPITGQFSMLPFSGSAFTCMLLVPRVIVMAVSHIFETIGLFDMFSGLDGCCDLRENLCVHASHDSSLTIWADTPVDHLCLVDDETRIVGRFQAWSLSNRTINIDGCTAFPTNEVMMIISNPIFIPSR